MFLSRDFRIPPRSIRELRASDLTDAPFGGLVV